MVLFLVYSSCLTKSKNSNALVKTNQRLKFELERLELELGLEQQQAHRLAQEARSNLQSRDTLPRIPNSESSGDGSQPGGESSFNQTRVVAARLRVKRHVAPNQAKIWPLDYLSLRNLDQLDDDFDDDEDDDEDNDATDSQSLGDFTDYNSNNNNNNNEIPHHDDERPGSNHRKRPKQRNRYPGHSNDRKSHHQRGHQETQPQQCLCLPGK